MRMPGMATSDYSVDGVYVCCKTFKLVTNAFFPPVIQELLLFWLYYCQLFQYSFLVFITATANYYHTKKINKEVCGNSGGGGSDNY